MKKLFLITLVFAISLTLGFGIALAGNGAPKGPHYNLNIIGVDNAKSAKMIDSKRHTIFVPLYSPKTVHNNRDGSTVDIYTQIFLKESPEGEDFKVCDGNGFDEAYNCEGEQMSNRIGAVFQLPANADWECRYEDTDSDPTTPDEYVCTPDGLAYYVYARALGTPGGKATITTCAYVDDGDGGEDVVCSTSNVIMERLKGKDGKLFKDVTRELTSICYLVYAADGVTVIGENCDSIFSDELYEYFWNYHNEGLRLLQLRFYTVPPTNGG